MAQAAAPYAKDAVEIAKGGQALLSFGKSIRSAISNKKAAIANFENTTLSAGGQLKSAEVLVKIAAETRSHIRIRQTGLDGSLIDIELNPSEATLIREQSSRASRQQAIAAAEEPAPQGSTLQSRDLLALRFADRIQDAASANYVEAIVEALLLAGGGHLVEQVASQLEGRGLHELAMQIRNSGRGGAPRQLVKY